MLIKRAIMVMAATMVTAQWGFASPSGLSGIAPVRSDQRQASKVNDASGKSNVRNHWDETAELNRFKIILAAYKKSVGEFQAKYTGRRGTLKDSAAMSKDEKPIKEQAETIGRHVMAIESQPALSSEGRTQVMQEIEGLSGMERFFYNQFSGDKRLAVEAGSVETPVISRPKQIDEFGKGQRHSLNGIDSRPLQHLHPQ